MKRILYPCALLSLFALHIAVRLRPASQVFGSSETEPLFAGADSFCHAQRIRLLFEQSPRWVFHDRFMFHPQGTIVEWPLGFDWGVANVLRVFTSSWETAVWWLPWTTLAISLVALGVFLSLARSVLTQGVALLLAGCFALNLAFSRVSTLAELDHHVVETLCLALLLWIPTTAPAWTRRQAIAVGFTLAWSIWNSTLLAFVVFGFFGLWLLTLQVRRSPVPALRDFAPALLAPLFVVSAIEAHARSAYFAFNTLSLLHPLLIATALVGVLASSRISPAKLWGTVALLVALSVVVAPGVLAWIGNFVTARDPVIGNINESRPLFSSLDGFTWTYAHAFFGPAYVLFPIAWLMLLRAHAPNAKSSAWLPLPLPTLALSLALFVLSLAQKRFAHLFVPGLLLVVGVWAARLPRQNVALALVALLLIEPAIVFFPETAHAIPDNARVAFRVAHVLRDAAAGRDDLGVSAPPNFGSAINYAGRLPVVTSAFFYPRYLQADLAVRSFEATSDLIAYLRKQRLGYLVTVDDARYRTMLLKMLGQPELATQASAWERTPCSGALLRYAYDRIACGVERPDALNPLMHERISNDPTRLWRQLRVFGVRD